MAEDRGARGSSSPVELLIRIAALLHAPSLSRARILLAQKFAAAVSRCLCIAKILSGSEINSLHTFLSRSICYDGCSCSATSSYCLVCLPAACNRIEACSWKISPSGNTWPCWLLEALRDYWRSLNANPRTGYFRADPGTLPIVPLLPERCGMRANVLPSGRDCRTGFIPHAETLFRYALARKRSRPAHHSTAPGTSRSEGNHDLSSSLATASQRHCQSAGLAQAER